VVQSANVYTVTFGGSLANTNVSQMTASAAGGATASVATANDGGCATTLVNTATAAVPAGVTDPNPANNSATDTDSVATIVASAQIPTLSQWTLLMLGSLLVFLALATLRRRSGGSG